MDVVRLEKEIAGSKLTLEVGRVAKQADGAVLARYGDTVVLATACFSEDEVETEGFFPLTVHFVDKFYAAGKIPGGFIKREGKPSEREILTSRLIDRSIRPLFPKKGFKHEVQVIVTAMSADQIHPTDVLGIIAASAALTVSSIPFDGPVGGVRIGIKDGSLIVNPELPYIEESPLDIVVSGTNDGIVMVEGGAKEVSEQVMIEALAKAEEVIKELIEIQEELREKVGKEKIEFEVPELPDEIKSYLREIAEPLVKNAINDPDKKNREKKLKEVKERVLNEVLEKFADFEEVESLIGLMKDEFGEVEKEVMRKQILDEGVRVDGRKEDEIRPISIEVGVLPRTHGSALFTRGQTQSLGVVTLGSSMDVQIVDEPEEEGVKRFMLHYNFPPFSVGEVRRIGAPSRREIGHGHLAERAVSAVLPDEEEFPYTVRVVSEILESNGSSSMATVCSASLSLMDAGVPIKEHVAGIAMGIIYEGKDRYKILTDIQGMEDHLGDMDFKVAGTKNGITGFQMDVKVAGLPREILTEALERARKARMFILDKMNKVISAPSKDISEYAPRVRTLKIDVSKIGEIIGPGGKNVKRIKKETGASVFIDENGLVTISARPGEGDVDRAYEMVSAMAGNIKVGDVFEGIVKRVEDYGVFVEIVPGKEGLVHISNLFNRRVNNIKEIMEPGMKLKVVVIGFDDLGRLKLSHKDVKD